MQKITPFLWYKGQAEEAVNLYTSIFKNSKIVSTMRNGSAAGPWPQGAVISVTFQLEGVEYIAFNGGPDATLTHAFSMMVVCDTQAEIDEYWDKLLADGGAPMACGWLTDKFGLSWQITPRVLLQYIQGPDPIKAERAMKAMMDMIKLDIATLQKAYDGE